MALDSAASVGGGGLDGGDVGGTSGDDKTSNVAAETKASFSSAIDTERIGR